MKAITLILIVTAFVMNAAFNVYAGDNKKTTISVPSIQCNSCKKNITEALKNVDGVIDVQVNLKNKEAVVTYDDSKTDLSSLEGAITASGYDANDKKADPAAYEKLDDCCKVPGKP